MSSRDDIYKQELENISGFVFNKKVANVFPDMLKRSIPGYEAIVNVIGVLAGEYARPQTNIYDLGCSLGACALSMQKYIDKKGCKIIAVDNSEDMIKRCKEILKSVSLNIPIEVILGDIADVDITNASVIAMNFVLQFFNPERREQLLRKIYNGMKEDSVFILSEKIAGADKTQDDAYNKMQYLFKRQNGYSDLEISQKRTALENILISDTLEMHIKRLKEAGFKDVNVWFQCFNFVSMVAIK
ncbi:MAG: carboxy-S-adenosyl-L-methionine synthase CmoA [Elusimicrobiota bacterium]